MARLRDGEGSTSTLCEEKCKNQPSSAGPPSPRSSRGISVVVFVYVCLSPHYKFGGSNLVDV